MPEYPDIVVYLEALGQRIMGQTLDRVTVATPFLLRTAVPPITSVEGRKVVELRRMGKRICIRLEDDLWMVLHLMIAGRLHWAATAGSEAGPNRSGRSRTSAGSRKRSSKIPKNGTFLRSFSSATGRFRSPKPGRRGVLHFTSSRERMAFIDSTPAAWRFLKLILKSLRRGSGPPITL